MTALKQELDRLSEMLAPTLEDLEEDVERVRAKLELLRAASSDKPKSNMNGHG